MARRPKPPARDQSKLTGKPLRQTLIPSPIYHHDEAKDEAGPEISGSSTTTENAKGAYTKGWLTSPDLYEENLPFSPEAMTSLANFLLANPNQNASHLFRADILFDSSGELKTPLEKERLLALNHQTGHRVQTATHEPAIDQRQQQQVETKYPAANIQGLELQKTVVLTLIPRNLNLDKPMNQTCYFYQGSVASPTSTGKTVHRLLQIRFPHVDSAADMPFYHPLLRGFAFMYDYETESLAEQGHLGPGKGTLSLHILPFPAADGFDPFPTRLERTLQALLATHIRLARSTQSSLSPPGSSNSQRPRKENVDDTYNPFQDNLIPRHLIQNTYTRLKLTYAHQLCENWVENTEPSKHVFEDLSITAFLIELWRNMYGVTPKCETDNDHDNAERFPGFVDVACGNGVLVYILLMEGYKGWGFDARRRKTWSTFPDWVQQSLHESLYIPKPFAIEASSREADEKSGKNQKDGYIIADLESNGIAYHTGDFATDTFIISNHADELTVWTPLMAALACPDAPLPFVSIPCCSHSLSGARYRYPPPKRPKDLPKDKRPANFDDHVNDREEEHKEEEGQPATGDLKALRKAKIASSTSQPGADLESPGVLNSMYGSLTAKTMNIAAEIGYDVEKTLLRIPSTRNMGVVGGRRSTIQKRINRQSVTEGTPNIRELIDEIIQRECAREGGVGAASNIWIQRAMGLQRGKTTGGH